MPYLARPILPYLETIMRSMPVEEVLQIAAQPPLPLADTPADLMPDEPRKTCFRCGHDYPISQMRPTLHQAWWVCARDCRDELGEMERRFEAALDQLHEMPVVHDFDETLDDITEELMTAFSRVLQMARENRAGTEPTGTEPAQA